MGRLPIESPDERDPSLRFERYGVEPTTLAYVVVDHLSDAQVRAIEELGLRIMKRDELLDEWRRRAAAVS